MYEDKTVAVVVPAHNEERFVGTVIETVPPFVDRVFVVDDRSTDDTWRVVRRAAERANAAEPVALVEDGGFDADRRVVPIRHDRNRGRGAAVKTGYRRALAEGYDVVAVMDGDGQMDPDLLSSIVHPVATGAADYATGDRFASAGDWDGMPFLRVLGSRVLTVLTRIASGYWHLRDSQNGYTAISADALRTIDLQGLYDDYGFLNDVLVKLNVADRRVVNVPIRARYGDEESGIRLGRLIPSLSGLLLRDFLWRLRAKYLDRGTYSVVGLYALGVVGVIAGLFGGLLVAEAIGGMRSSGVATVLVGVLSLIGAMALDRRRNEHLRP